MARESSSAAALACWTEFQAEGYVLEEEKLLSELPWLTNRVPWSEPMCLDAHGSRSPQLQLFIDMLRVKSGKVQFLYFWKAFRDMSSLSGSTCQGVAAELETLRDGVLRRLESAERNTDGSDKQRRFSDAKLQFEQPKIVAYGLLEELHRAAAMSGQPRFWQAAASSLDAAHAGALGLPQVSGVLVGWLREAAVWDALHELDGSGAASSPLGASLAAFSPFGGVSGLSSGTAVRLQLYDASEEAGQRQLEVALFGVGEPESRAEDGSRNCALFHLAVEVGPVEWSYGGVPGSQPKVRSCAPRQQPGYQHRHCLEMGRTHLSDDAIGNVVSLLVESYELAGTGGPVQSCEFAEQFLAALGTGSVPDWVRGLASMANQVDCLLVAAEQLRSNLQQVRMCPTPPRSPRELFERIPMGLEDEGYTGNARELQGGFALKADGLFFRPDPDSLVDVDDILGKRDTVVWE